MSNGVIDCDVHPLVSGGIAPLFPYLDNGWKRRLEPRKRMDPYFTESPSTPPHIAGGTNRLDATPPSGGLPASDPAFVAEQLLDSYGIEIAVLLPFQPARLSRWGDSDEPITLTQAYNMYFVGHWLEADDRYRLAIVVAPHDPRAAAAEIRRQSDTRGVVAVWVPPFQFGLGFRYYDPIYAAAQKVGLPIMFHVGAGDDNYANVPGHASSCERYALQPSTASRKLSNLIFEGAVSRFPELNFIFVAYGWTWVPAQLWLMDEAWKTGRQGSPWVAMPPSEHAVERIRFTSQPADHVPKSSYRRMILEAMQSERTLLFASDYPHLDSDYPGTAFMSIDRELQHRILRQSAIETFGDRLAASR